MTARPLPPSRETIESIREAYAKGAMSIHTIAETFRVSKTTVYYWVDGGPATGEKRMPPLPRRTDGRARSGHRRLTGDRIALVRRMWRTADAQVRDIEKRLTKDGQKPSERERDMRLFATLAKTLRELSAAERGERPDTPAKKPAERDDGTVPRNIDDLRQALSRKLEAFIAGRRTPVRSDA